MLLCEVHVLAIDDKAAQGISELGYVFHPRHWQNDTSPFLSSFLAIFQLIFIILKMSPKIVHCIGLKSAPIALVPSLLFWRSRFIFSINGLGYFFPQNNQNFFSISDAIWDPAFV